MSQATVSNLIRGAILASLATLMVAGFLVMGGLSKSDSAEALRCSKRWFDRCSDFSTTLTEDLAVTTTTSTEDETSGPPSTTTSTKPPTLTTTTSSVGGFLNCSKRWFNRCSEFTTETLSDTSNPNFPD